MASIRALAVRRAAAEARLTAHAERLAGDTPRPAWNKQPDVAAIERLEWAADLLDTAGSAPAAAAPTAEVEAQLAETTTIAADLFDQVAATQHATAPKRGGRPA